MMKKTLQINNNLLSISILLILLFGGLSFGSSSQQDGSQSNTSLPASVPIQNTITTSGSSVGNVLILYSSELTGATSIQSTLQSYNYKVDLFESSAGTPTLSTLANYDLIIAVGSVAPTDAVTLGNNLADYVDQGGNLIAFAYTFVDIWSITGRLLTDGYFPLTAIKNDNVPRTYDGLSTHSIFAGVTSLTTSSMNTTVTTGASVFAYHTDGEPFAAEKGNVISINSYSSLISGDKDTLIVKAVGYLLHSKVLVLYSSELPGATSIQSTLRSYNYKVDLFESSAGTPTLSTLVNYDLVIAIGSVAPTDAVTLGNNLADYVDLGGNLIAFAYTFVDIWSITGRLLTDGYFPLTAINNDNVPRTYDGLSTHPIFAGVTTLTTSSMNTTVTTGASVFAYQTDGEPLAAEKGNVISINSYSSAISGDKTSLITNAVNYLLLPKILVLYSSELAGATSIQSTLQSYNYKVDLFESSAGTPTLGTLANYDLIIAVGSVAPTDAVTLGNNLADYVDQGGNLIAFAYTFVDIWSITGRLLTDGYFPLTAINNDNIGRTYDGLSTHPIFAGVTTLTTNSMNTNVTAGASVFAYHTDGEPLAAEKGNVISINSYSSVITGDKDTLIVNAVGYLLQSKVLVLYSGELPGATSIQSTLRSYNYKVDLFESSAGTPTLGTLANYDLIIAIGSVAPTDAVTLGNNLADYVDQGGNLIAFAYTFVDIWSITGRLLTDGYFPLTAINNDNVGRTYDGLSTHPIFAGVTTLTTSSMNTNVTTGASVFAYHTDGEPFAAEKGNVISINSYLSAITGDKDKLLVNAVSYLLNVKAPDFVSPTFESFPIDNIYEEGSAGNTISWTLRDDNPGTYTLKINGVVLESDPWADGDTITTSLDSLTAGVYVIELVAEDVNGNSASHSVTITIFDATLPLFTFVPAGLSYYAGEVDNFLEWKAFDLNPNYYVLYQDGINIQTGTWESTSAISVSVDGLLLGTYNFTIQVFDASGNSASHYVLVTVSDPPITTTTPTPTTTTTTTTTSTSDVPTTTTTTTTSDPPTTTDDPTTSEQTSSSESNGDTDTSDTPELPIPFSNIYVIMFSILGLAYIARRHK